MLMCADLVRSVSNNLCDISTYVLEYYPDCLTKITILFCKSNVTFTI